MIHVNVHTYIQTDTGTHPRNCTAPSPVTSEEQVMLEETRHPLDFDALVKRWRGHCGRIVGHLVLSVASLEGFIVYLINIKIQVWQFV